MRNQISYSPEIDLR